MTDQTSRSATADNEGYPGIAHDFEKMRFALTRILDITQHEPLGNLGNALGGIARAALPSHAAGIMEGSDMRAPEQPCYGCGKPLVIENAWAEDGCPCNTPAGVNNLNLYRWRLLHELQQQQSRKLEAKQAEIDRLMLEFCPDEMTEEQKANWARHQRPATAAETAAIDAAARPSTADTDCEGCRRGLPWNRYGQHFEPIPSTKTLPCKKDPYVSYGTAYERKTGETIIQYPLSNGVPTGETPRTDALQQACAKTSHGRAEFGLALDLSRQLERELAPAPDS